MMVLIPRKTKFAKIDSSSRVFRAIFYRLCKNNMQNLFLVKWNKDDKAK